MDLSVVIPAYNRADLLQRCLACLEDSRGVDWEATIVDNASPEDLGEVRAHFPRLRWLRSDRNIGYAAANNRGLAGAGGRHVCWLNADAEVEPETLAALVRHLDQHPRAGAVTPRNVSLSGETQPSLSPEHTLAMAWLRDSGWHLLFPNAWPFREWMLPRFDWECEQAVATSQTTCLAIRGEAYRQVGEMDEALFLFYNDVDYCRRLRQAGWTIVYLPAPVVRHHGSACVETAPWKERRLWLDRYHYFLRWHGRAGALGVRAALLHRTLTRCLVQLPRGRPGAAPGLWRQGVSLLRELGHPPIEGYPSE